MAFYPFPLVILNDNNCEDNNDEDVYDDNYDHEDKDAYDDIRSTRCPILLGALLPESKD